MCQSRLLRLAQQTRRAILPGPSYCCNPPQGSPLGIQMRRELQGPGNEMDDIVARAACDFKDDAPRRQDIAKDIENEIAIAQCRRRVLAVVAHSSSRIPGTPVLG